MDSRAFDFYVFGDVGATYSMPFLGSLLLRFGTDFDFGFDANTFTSGRIDSGSSTDPVFRSAENDFDEHGLLLRVSAPVIVPLAIHRNAYAYLGAGPMAAVNVGARTTNQLDLGPNSQPNGVRRQTEDTYRTIGFGLGGVIGVKAFVLDRLSISAEYRITAQYEIAHNFSLTRVIEEAGTSKFDVNSDRKGFTIDVNQLRIGVGVHF